MEISFHREKEVSMDPLPGLELTMLAQNMFGSWSDFVPRMHRVRFGNHTKAMKLIDLC